MRITIDDDTAQMIQEMKNQCKQCDDLPYCDEPYNTTKNIVKSAMTSFLYPICESKKGDGD